MDRKRTVRSHGEGWAPAPEDPEEDWSPAPERLISDVETLKALSDPLRLRIIETMVRRVEPAWTVKELAAVLTVPATRLYHHVELLQERDLVRAAGRRLVSGIVETRYRVSALSLRLDRSLFSGDSAAAVATMNDVLATLFDSARDEIQRGIASGRIAAGEDAPPERKLFMLKGLSRLAPDRAVAFQDRLKALLDEFGGGPGQAPGDAAYAMVIAIYPVDPTSPVESSYPERQE